MFKTSNLKISTQLGHTEQPSRSRYLPLIKVQMRYRHGFYVK